MTIRLLFVGFEEKDVPLVPENLDIYYEVAKWDKLPTLYDYDVIVTDLHDLNYGNIERACKDKAKFLEQVETGGLLIIFFAPNKRYVPSQYGPHYCRHEWVPKCGYVETREETGESVTILESSFKPFFETIGEENISWELHFRKKVKGAEEPVELLTNRAGYPISLEIPVGKGKIVLLPLFSDRREAMKNLLEIALPQIYPNVRKPPIKQAERVTRPGWVEESIFEKKRDLMEKVELHNKDIRKYTELEALIYSKDIELVQSVALALKELGFQIAVTAKEGTVPDLEIKFNEKYNAVAEVKGLISPLKIEHLRQLLHYFIDKRDVEGVEDIKAVFFVNHQLNRKPENRDSVPCTTTALDTAQKHDIAIVSTYDLFEALRKVVHEKGTREEMRRKIINGVGHVNLTLS